MERIGSSRKYLGTLGVFGMPELIELFENEKKNHDNEDAVVLGKDEYKEEDITKMIFLIYM